MTSGLLADGPGTEDRSWARRSGTWLLPLVLFLATLGVFAATAERHHINTDAYAASAGAWRLASTGSPWMDGIEVKELKGTHGAEKRGTWLSDAPNGHVVTQRMAGPILAGLPFYLLLDRGSAPAGFSIAAGGIAASVVSAAAVLLIFLSVRRKLPPSVALAAALAFGLATPTWSVSANGLWTHPVTQLGIAGAAYALSRERWWLAGAFLGVGMLGRPHIALIAAVVGLGMSLSQRRVKPALGLALPTVAALGFLEVWNHYVYGEWSIGGAYGDGRIAQAGEGLGQSQASNYLGFLFSADRGFLVWTPVVLLLVPALLRSWRSLPAWSRWLCLGGLLYSVAQLRLNYFAGGVGFYGYRHGLELLTCITPALALSLPRMGRVARVVVPPVVMAQFAAITIGATVEAFFVPLGHVWTDNSFWLALRHQPGLVGGWLALCVMIGVLGSLALHRRTRSPLQRVASDTSGGVCEEGLPHLISVATAKVSRDDEAKLRSFRK